MRQEKKVRLWWLFWLPNMIRYFIWPGIEFVWVAYPVVQSLVFLVAGFLLNPAIRFVWNSLWPEKAIGDLGAMLVLATGLGFTAFLTKTPTGNDIVSLVIILVVIAGCLAWLLLAALPALVVYGLARWRKADSLAKTLGRLYLSPLDWADRRFFLTQRTGNK